MDTEPYRDDRMFVLRVTSDFRKIEDDTFSVTMKIDKEVDFSKPTIIVTYRNTARLPSVRVDEFPSRWDALEYVKKVEPTCPRVSLGGRPAQPALTWSQHLNWLHSEGLRSAAEGDTPLPEGTDEKTNPRELLIRGGGAQNSG